MRSAPTRRQDAAPPRNRPRHGRNVACIASATLTICLVLLAAMGAARVGPSLTIAQAGELDGYGPQNTSAHVLGPMPVRRHPGGDFRVDDFHVHIPPGAAEPLQALVALHGMGGGGEESSEAIHSLTDPQGWVIVAPTFRYGDWRDPDQVTQEAGEQLPRIAAFLDRLPAITGLRMHPRALLYGYSRGGQTANRFALAFPDRVAGAALISSGTYTLPAAVVRGERDFTALRFPYGVANFAELFGRTFDAEAFTNVPFWIGVGARDSDPADVPHQWDPYIGNHRVERAQRFAAWLERVGVRAQLQIFPGVGHAETDAVRAAAMAFLAGQR